jgi:hypothetical protein
MNAVSGMLRHVVLVGTDVSEERLTIIRVRRLVERGGARFLGNVGSYKSYMA